MRVWSEIYYNAYCGLEKGTYLIIMKEGNFCRFIFVLFGFSFGL